nr:homeobox protein ceh-43-like [Maniola hyperantus]
MYQNVLMTVTPLSEIKDEINCWENRPFMHSWPESNQHKAFNKDTVKKTIKKKSKRNRTAYTTDQLRVLEKTFARTKYVDAERRKELAEHLKIGEKCVKVWFQNRRMKDKKECSESSNDSSSEYVAPEPVTPPSGIPIQLKSEDQYVQSNNSYIEQSIRNNNAHTNTESQPYHYSYEENCKTFHQACGVGYQNYVPFDYRSYSMPTQYTNGYYNNGATLNPTQYYSYSGVPEYMYLNVDNNQYVQEQQNTIESEVSNWSDLSYF